VMTHVPWYSSNALHVAEAELMRQAVEPLLYHGGVDLVISGHVHAYERVLPVYQGCLNRCAPAYLTIGDGGNREGASVQWSEPQPAWSAFRESSFGSGALDIINDTHALFNWSRFACEGSTSPDHVDFNRSCESMTWGPFARRDTSGFSARRSDSAWLIRNRSGCSATASDSCIVPHPPSSPHLPPPAFPPANDQLPSSTGHVNSGPPASANLMGGAVGFASGFVTAACIFAFLRRRIQSQSAKLMISSAEDRPYTALRQHS